MIQWNYVFYRQKHQNVLQKFHGLLLSHSVKSWMTETFAFVIVLDSVYILEFLALTSDLFFVPGNGLFRGQRHCSQRSCS